LILLIEAPEFQSATLDPVSVLVDELVHVRFDALQRLSEHEAHLGGKLPELDSSLVRHVHLLYGDPEHFVDNAHNHTLDCNAVDHNGLNGEGVEVCYFQVGTRNLKAAERKLCAADLN
jgi:hypothetical protein